MLVVQPSSEHHPSADGPAWTGPPEDGGAPTQGDPRLGPVEVRRSRRRSRTVTAYREAGRTIVAIPAGFTRAQEREWVRRMLDRLANQ